MRLASAVAAAVLTLAACAALKNTPAQDLAWQRWEKCNRFPYVSLKEIRPNGDIWVSYGQPDGYAQWRDCELAARAEQRAAGKSSSTGAPLSTDDLATLVSAAFFTAAPPAPNTYLTAFHNVERRDVFAEDVPVTFFYRLRQIGRILSIETRWFAPDGVLVKSLSRTMNQYDVPGGTMWQTQTLPAADLSSQGVWTVELLIDGRPIGRYSFTRRRYP